MWKSRLADEKGKRNYQFPFVFRNAGDTTHPPGDTEITDYFQQRSDDPSIPVVRLYAALGGISKSGVPPDFEEQLLTVD